MDYAGYSKEEVLDKNLVEFLYQDKGYRATVNQVFAQALKGQETTNFELMLHTKSGARVEILLNASCRMDYDGNIVGVVGVGQDITDLKRAEKEVKHIAQDLARLIDTANAPIFGIDQKGKVNEWNAKVAQITGFSREEVMGRHLVSTFISSEFQYAVCPRRASFGMQSLTPRYVCGTPWDSSAADERFCMAGATGA